MWFRLLLCVVVLARLAAAQEPDTTRRAAGATVSGVVRDSIARIPLAGAVVQLVAAGVTVTGEWLEFSFTPKGLGRRIPRPIATTAENGWFAICNLPSAGTVALMASRGTICR